MCIYTYDYICSRDRTRARVLKLSGSPHSSKRVWYVLVTWLIHTGHYSFILARTYAYKTWLYAFATHVLKLLVSTRPSSYGTRSFTQDMTYSYGTWPTWRTHMRRDSFKRDMTHLYETWLVHTRHDSSIWDGTRSPETWLIHLLTEEIRLEIFRSRHLSVFPIDLLSDGDSIHSTEKVYEILGIPVKTCSICMGTPVKTC